MMTHTIAPYTLAVLRLLMEEECRRSELYGSPNQIRKLQTMEDDGLIIYDGTHYRITNRGRELHDAMQRLCEQSGNDAYVDYVIHRIRGRNDRRKAYMAEKYRRSKEGGIE